MDGESWTMNKAEHQRIDAFELWCWRRLLRVPWTARRSNQSILKEISPRSEERRVGKECQTLYSWAPKSLKMVIVAMKLKDGYSLEEKL